MYAFYAVRGQELNDLAELSSSEKVFLHCAREQYWNELGKFITTVLGGGANS